jgi:hypothetical protein
MGHFRSQETVDSALRMSDEGVSDRVNAEIHGVAIKTIRRWRRLYQRRGLPRGTAFQGYPELNQEIAATIRLVKPTASPCLRNGQGMIRIEAPWKHWPCLFPQHGPGLKHLRKIELADWQREIVAKYPEQLLRGLFHSDGSRFVNWASKPGVEKRYYYVRYMFSNESEDIIGILTAALDLLGIPWRRPRRNVIAVSRKEGVAALDTFVGPKS